jgi:hypothetical protein
MVLWLSDYTTQKLSDDSTFSAQEMKEGNSEEFPAKGQINAAGRGIACTPARANGNFFRNRFA